MKKQFTFFATLLLAAVTSANAAVHTVSNRAPVPGQFITIDAAIAAATDGDTIYVHGSPANYLDATINKRITLIGTGYDVPNSDSLTADLDNLTLTTGATGSIIIGMNLYYVATNATLIDSITFQRNRIRYQIRMNNSNLNYWTIDGNFFEYTANCIEANNVEMDFFMINNNIFNGYLQSFNYYGNGSNLVIRNNLFLGPNQGLNGVYYAYIYNNIFYRASPSTGATSCAFSANLSYQCANNGFPNGVNQVNVDPLFVNFPAAGDYYNRNYDFHLQPGSTAIAAGNDGLDLGIYGGNGHYNHGGIPAIPQIRSFSISGSNVIAPGTSINVNIISTIKP